MLTTHTVNNFTQLISGTYNKWIFFSCQKSPEAELRFNGPQISEKDAILFDFVTEPTTSQEALKSSPIVPYNFADRQLRHSNQSGKGLYLT